MKPCVPLQAPGPPRSGLVSIIIGAEDEDFENELEAVSRVGWESVHQGPSSPSWDVSSLLTLSSLTPCVTVYSSPTHLTLTPVYHHPSPI